MSQSPWVCESCHSYVSVPSDRCPHCETVRARNPGPPFALIVIVGLVTLTLGLGAGVWWGQREPPSVSTPPRATVSFTLDGDPPPPAFDAGTAFAGASSDENALAPAFDVASGKAVKEGTLWRLAADADPTLRWVHTSDADGTRMLPPPQAVAIPGGTFTMGVSVEEVREFTDARPALNDSESMRMAPAHTRHVRPFWFGQRELSNAQYAAYLQATAQSASEALMSLHWEGRFYDPELAFAGREHEPVAAITWDEATACARWLGHRLPTEAEWERAARWCVGQGRYSVWNEQGFADPRTPDDAPPPDITANGVHALCSGVSEWTASWLMPYPGTPETASFGPDESTALFRAVRGGNRFGPAINDNVVYRLGQIASGFAEGVGARLVASASPYTERLIRQAMRARHVRLSERALDLRPHRLFTHTVQRGSEEVAERVHWFDFAPAVAPHSHRLRRLVSNPTSRPAALITTNAAMVDPQLPPGDYALIIDTTPSGSYSVWLDGANGDGHPEATVQVGDEIGTRGVWSHERGWSTDHLTLTFSVPRLDGDSLQVRCTLQFERDTVYAPLEPDESRDG